MAKVYLKPRGQVETLCRLTYGGNQPFPLRSKALMTPPTPAGMNSYAVGRFAPSVLRTKAQPVERSIFPGNRALSFHGKTLRSTAWS